MLSIDYPSMRLIILLFSHFFFSFLYVKNLCRIILKNFSCSNFAFFGKTKQLGSKKSNYTV